MKGILFLRRGDGIGGIEELILLLAKDLEARRIFKPMLAAIDLKAPFAQRFNEFFPGSVFALPYEQGLYSNQALSTLDGIVRGHNVAVIQSEMFRESLLGRRYRKANAEVRHVFHAHTYIQRAMIPSWKKTAYHALDWLTSGGVDAFASISDFNRREMISHSRITEGKIHIIPNGITPLGPPDLPVSSPRLKPAVAIIANLMQAKQQHLAIQAVGELKREGLPIDLHLIGEASEKEYARGLKDLTADLGLSDLVHFHGAQPREDIGALIRDIPVVALPSLSEGLPTCIVEAMSMRKLAIATRVGATSELVEHGENGILLDDFMSHESLKAAMKDVFTSPAERWEPMRDAGYRTWANKYRVERMADDFIRLYQHLGVM